MCIEEFCADPACPTEILRRTRRAPLDNLRKVKECILENLSSQELSVRSIAARHGITDRYVRMLFERAGTTFSAFVLKHRLELAWCVLCDESSFHKKISAIAFDCGFRDLSWFNRQFRRQFKMSPSMVRRAAQELARSGTE